MQPMYMLAPCDREQHGPRARQAPLELKVQVLFGEVVGGTLNTHPGDLWVTRAGGIQVWDQWDLRSLGHTRCKKMDQFYGRGLAGDTLNMLRRALAQSWPDISAVSARIASAGKLDELRVDWLLGDAVWGPRIGELTYMGAGSRITPPVSKRLA